MIIILNTKATSEQINEVTKEYEGYTKVVVDIEQEILAAGGEYHIDCEQVLIANGSSLQNLWGGGYRFKIDEVDFMALTNYKAAYGHFTYEISDPSIRQKVEKVIRKVFSK
ncbi:MAG: hypothetical protein ACD_22C00190G0003 [uncultured bacterium]|nr:MAG: hypothetical protein ACD_22C00190G0003 [uncultured bacterium]